MIKPTIGRQVWLWRLGSRYGTEQPEAATVVYVHSERMVNLQVLDHQGLARRMTSVPLVQPEDPQLAQGVVVEQAFAEWMPYQVGQAKANEVPR